MSSKRKPDGTKKAPFTYRLSYAEERAWVDDPEDVRRAARETHPRGYVRIVRPKAGSPLVDVMEDPGWTPPPRPARPPPKPVDRDTFSSHLNEAIGYLTAAQSSEERGDHADALRCLDDAATMMGKARGKLASPERRTGA